MREDMEFVQSIYNDATMTTCFSGRFPRNIGYAIIRFDGKIAYDWLAGSCANPDEAWQEARENIHQRMLAKLIGDDLEGDGDL